MAIKKQVRDQTKRRLGCRTTAYYEKVKEVQRRYGTITRDDAGYVLAAENGVDLTKHLDPETCSRIMEIRSKAPPSQVTTAHKATQPRTRHGRDQESVRPEVPTRAGTSECRRRPRDVIDCLRLHPQIGHVARRLFLDTHYTQAVEQAFKRFNNAVKKKAGCPKDPKGKELDGAALMTTAFSLQHPILRLNSLQTESEKNEQQGYMHIAQGAMIGLRNPRAHEDELKDQPERALELLGLASYLMTRLDDAKRVRRRSRGKCA